jgi:Flp pilus assembly protein protease CpaA
MSHYEYFLIFLALVFCAYASYTDLKTQKIRNFCSLGLLYVGTLSQVMAWYLGTTTPLYILGLFCGSGLIAFALYWFGIFSPGDSKLFWGLCLIFPLSLFRNLSGALGFPPLVLALNIIVPYSIGILGYLLFKFILRQNKLDFFRYFFKSNFQKAALLEKFFSLLLFIGIGSVLTYLLQRVGWEPDRFLRLVLVLVAFTLIQKLLSLLPKTPVYYAVISFVCIWLAMQTTPSVSVFLSGFAFFLGLYFVVFVIAKQLVLSLASITLDNAVDVNGLQVGMIPAEQIVRVEQQDGTIHYEKKQVGFSSGQDDNIVISPDPSGLTTEEIAQLRELAAEGVFAEFGNRINVQPSIRFAPVIFIGALLTVLCQGPFYLKLL